MKMRVLKNLSLILLVLFSFTTNAQTDKATTTKIIEERNFEFVANTAIPMNSAEINAVLSKMSGNSSGGAISLVGSNYTVKIAKDSVIAYLPYYGRAFSAPIGSDESGFKFTSTDFTYDVKKKKKHWQITINTTDTKNSPKLVLSVSENGYASLFVISNNKQSITYSGYIAEITKKD